MWFAIKVETTSAAKTGAYVSLVAGLRIGTARAGKIMQRMCRQVGSQTSLIELGWLQAMDRALLVTLKGRDQIDMVLSSVEEIIDSGTSVVFSFTKSGQVTVLFTSPPSPAQVGQPYSDDNRINNHRVIERSEE